MVAIKIKGPAHRDEGGHPLEKPPTPTHSKSGGNTVWVNARDRYKICPKRGKVHKLLHAMNKYTRIVLDTYMLSGTTYPTLDWF